MRPTPPKTALLVLMLLSVGLLTGCGRTKAIFVSEEEPVRVREKVTVKVWVLDKDGVEIEGEKDVMPGKWIVDDPGEE